MRGSQAFKRNKLVSQSIQIFQSLEDRELHEYRHTVTIRNPAGPIATITIYTEPEVRNCTLPKSASLRNRLSGPGQAARVCQIQIK